MPHAARAPRPPCRIGGGVFSHGRGDAPEPVRRRPLRRGRANLGTRWARAHRPRARVAGTRSAIARARRCGVHHCREPGEDRRLESGAGAHQGLPDSPESRPLGGARVRRLDRRWCSNRSMSPLPRLHRGEVPRWPRRSRSCPMVRTFSSASTHAAVDRVQIDSQGRAIHIRGHVTLPEFEGVLFSPLLGTPRRRPVPPRG